MVELENWILRNVDLFKIKWTEYTWPSRWWQGLNDFSCEIQFNNELFIGRGSDINKRIALIKSFSEAIERIVGKCNSLENSNGISAHYDKILCQNNSKSELIERDQFFLHYFSKTPFAEFSSDEIKEIVLPLEFIKKVKNSGVRFYLRKLFYCNDMIGVGVFAFGKGCKTPWGMCFGTSISTDLEAAVNKAYIECARHVIPLLNENKIDDLDIESFN